MRKKCGFTWIEALVIIGILAILAVILFPVFARPHPTPHRSNCQSNLKQISLGIKQYVQDASETYSLVASDFAPYGWADAIQPYLKSTQIYQCGSETTPPNKTADPILNGYTDYWFNSQMAGVKEEKFTFSSNTIMLGDGNDGNDATDARYAISRLPASWLKDNTSPLYRHLDGANFAFADGHVKWLKANGSQRDGKLSATTFSFSVQ